jgi:hypothetical protein
MVLRLGEEGRALRRPLRVGLVDIKDAHVHEGAGAVRIGRRRERDRGLVVGGAAANVEDQPRVRDLQDHRITLQHHLGVETIR